MFPIETQNVAQLSAPYRREFVHAVIVGAIVLLQGCTENTAEQEDDQEAYVMIQNLEAERLDVEVVVRDGSDERLNEEIRIHYTSDGGLEHVPIEIEDDGA